MDLGAFSEQVPERRSQLLGEMDDTQLSPEWLQKTSALVEGGLNSGWRPGATGTAAVAKIPSRFDTTSGPARWKDEGNGRRLDGGGAGLAGDRWTEVGPGGSHLAQTFPTELFSSGDRWAAPDPNAGRGRGRGMGSQDPAVVAAAAAGGGGTWKSREGAPVGAVAPVAGGPEWRGAGSEMNPRNDWRNDRWNAAPGSRTQDTWRGGPGGGRGAAPGGMPLAGNGGSVAGAPGGGLGSGFSVGRGTGTFTRSDSVSSSAGNGVGRALGASGRSPSSSFFRSFGPGGGVGGSLAWGPSKAQLRYTTDQLAFVYRQLLYSGRLKLPRSVERDDPLLFIADGDFVDVVEQFSGVDPRIAAEVYLEHQALMQRVHSRGFVPSGGPIGGGGGGGGGEFNAGGMTGGGGGGSIGGGMPMSPPQGQLPGLQEQHQLHQMHPHHHQQQHQQQMQHQQPHSAFLEPVHQQHQQQQQQQQQQQMMETADPGWVYRDPQGMLQGPFPKQDIIEWFDGGFFPLALQLRPATDPAHAPFYPLSDLLQIWRAPAAPAAMGGPAGFPQQQPQQQQQQQQPGFVGGMGMPQMGGGQEFMGLPPQHAQQQSGGLPNELMISDHLQHLNIGGLGANPLLGAPQQQHQQQQQQQQLHMAGDSLAPAPYDPIVDPSIVKRSASQSLLGQQEVQMQLPGAIGGGLLGAALTQSPVQQPQEPQQPAWTAAAPPAAAQAPAGLSLTAIQQEEAEEQRRQQQAMVNAGASHPPPPPPPPPGPAPGFEMEPPSPQRQRPETKVAPWVASVPTPESAGKTLLEIQAEEAERQAQLEAQLAAQAAANRAVGPPGGGWARVARGSTVSGPSSGPSLLEIQQAEERAKAAAAAAAAAPAAADDDDSLFWEYEKPSSGAPSAASGAVMPPPPPAPKAKVGGWAAAASKAPVPVPVAAKPAPVSIVRPPPPPPPRSSASSAMHGYTPSGADDSAAAAAAVAAAAAASDAANGGGDGAGNSVLSGPFRAWCVEQMQELTGSSDITLCEFLMTVESNSEVAEYVSTYLGATATAAKFSAEFLKLKLAEQASSGKKSRKARAKANAAAAALTNGTAAGKGKGASGSGGAGEDSSWAQVTDAGSKKTKKKGQKVDSVMLGFASGTNYSLLDMPE